MFLWPALTSYFFFEAKRKRTQKRRYDSGPSEWEKEILDTLKATSAVPPHSVFSEDQMFLLSLNSLLQKVPPHLKDEVKFKMHKLLFDNCTVVLNLEPLEPSE